MCYQNSLDELFHLQVGNNNTGFEKIRGHIGTHYHFMMEAKVYYIYLTFLLGALFSLPGTIEVSLDKKKVRLKKGSSTAFVLYSDSLFYHKFLQTFL